MSIEAEQLGEIDILPAYPQSPDGEVLSHFDYLVQGRAIPQAYVQISLERIQKAFEEASLSPEE